MATLPWQPLSVQGCRELRWSRYRGCRVAIIVSVTRSSFHLLIDMATEFTRSSTPTPQISFTQFKPTAFDLLKFTATLMMTKYIRSGLINRNNDLNIHRRYTESSGQEKFSFSALRALKMANWIKSDRSATRRPDTATPYAPTFHLLHTINRSFTADEIYSHGFKPISCWRPSREQWRDL